MVEAAPVSWTSEPQRLALIQGQRAAQLLRAAAGSNSSDAAGCDALQGPADSDTQYLMAEFLERGTASVLLSGKGQLEPKITVRYLGIRCGPTCGRGDILFHLPGDPKPFLVASWWVS